MTFKLSHKSEYSQLSHIHRAYMYIKMDSDMQVKINELSKKHQNLLQETHNKALLQNEMYAKRWEAYKKDHVELSDRLMSLRDSLSHSVMVPIGKRALMRGSLVHTNEIMVCLGDGWFAKQSAKQAADICHRRIQNCDEELRKLKKEEELLNSRMNFPFKNEAFCSDEQTTEIIEPYDEEKEKQWEEKHHQNVKEYRGKLAELRKTPKTKIETEDDLWRKLDALEMEEELKDTLSRLGIDMEEEIVDEEEEVVEEEEYDSDDSDIADRTSEVVNEAEKKGLQRRVSFKEEKDSSEIDQKSDLSDDNLMRIVFKHSDTSLSVSLSSDEIITPSDIYMQYLKQKTPKSILKPSSVANHMPVDFEVQKPQPVKTNSVEIDLPLLPVEPAIKAVHEEVVERTPSTTTVSVAERPVSRFKAARMATKR